MIAKVLLVVAVFLLLRLVAKYSLTDGESEEDQDRGAW